MSERAPSLSLYVKLSHKSFWELANLLKLYVETVAAAMNVLKFTDNYLAIVAGKTHL